MSNASNENNEINWVFFTHEMDGPKLAWFTSLLTNRGIPFRTVGTGISGKPILEIDYNSYMDAVSLINQTIPTQLDGVLTLRWADLPDNHEIFVEAASVDVGTVVSEPTPSFEDVHLPHVPGTIRMFDCESSNVSAVGATDAKGDKVGIFVRYKGGNYYRYGPCTDSTWALVYAEILNKVEGRPSASVGSLVNRVLKAAADEGTITCYKLKDDAWVKVQAKGKK